MLEPEEMKEITQGPLCASEGDYLSWKNSNWSIFGKVLTESIAVDELCGKAELFTYLFPAKFPEHAGCMEFCLKLKQSRSPPVENEDQAMNLKEWFNRVAFDPETNLIFPGLLRNFWARYSEPEVEGTWVDYYTKEIVPITIFGPGQPNGGRGANCGSSFYSWGCFMNDDPCLRKEFKNKNFISIHK